MSTEEKFLIGQGYNILNFEYEVISKVGNRLGSKPKRVKLAMKDTHVPDIFSDYPEMAIDHTIKNVFHDVFHNMSHDEI